MAHYDPSTDTIHGADPGTWAYYHEARHQWQFKKYPNLQELTAKVHIRSYYASIIASSILMLFYGWRGIIVGVGFGMLTHVLFILLMELDAYIMGTYQWLRR